MGSMMKIGGGAARYQHMLRMAKRTALVIGAGAVSVPLLSNLSVVSADENKKQSNMVKVSDLPIYDEPKDLYNIEYHVAEKGKFEEGVSTVRKELTEAYESTKEFQDQVSHIYQTGKAHTAGQVNYLLDEENVGARAGAIAVGGLFGLMLGSRRQGGFFKKLLYTSTGAGATTAALHPKETKELSTYVVEDANNLANVAYNFVIGVKPQDSTPAPVKAPKPSSPPKSEGAETVRRESENNRPVPDAADQSNPKDADMYTTRTK